MVLALGWYGARALAHLWPRLRIEDMRRDHVGAGLPLLRNLVSMVLVMANPKAQVVVGQPDPQRWSGSQLLKSILPAAQREDEGGLRELYGSLVHGQVYGDSDEAGSRQACFENALRNQRDIGDLLVQAAEGARVDEHAPGRGVHRLSVYVLAALSEERASALLWPLVMALRSRLEGHTALEVVGLLSTGVYGDATTRRDEGARVYAALRELDFFSQEEPDLRPFEPLVRLDPRPDRYFDRCYLLDSEKCNGARVRDEVEVITTTGNALEVFLLSDAPDAIAELIGPDEEYLRCRYPFSSLGAASTYIPVDRWQARNQCRFELEILDREFLRQEPQPLPADSTAGEAAARYTNLRQLVAELVGGCPFTLLVQDQSNSPRGDAARLLQAAHLDQPATKGWPELPLPEVCVEPSVARPTYRWEDPADGRSRRLPPEEWLRHLYEHFRHLGLGPGDIFPNDPEAAEFEATMERRRPSPPPAQPAGAGVPPVWATERERWLALMRQTATGEGGTEAAGSAGPHEPAGMVPQWAATLRREAMRLLQTEGQGLQGAIEWLRHLDRSLRQALAQAEDYQVRLLHALGSEAQAAARGRAAQRRLAFRRLLANRPHPASLLGRLVPFAALLTTVGVYALPRYGAPVNLAAPPWLLVLQLWLATHQLAVAAGLGLGVSALVFAATLGVHRLRLWWAIRRVERDLLRELNLLANQDVAAAVAVGETDPGLLPGLLEEVVLLRDVLLDTLSGLRARRDQLSADLAEATTHQDRFVREPLAGLEDWEEQLQQAARPVQKPLLPPAILSPDRQVAERLLDDFVVSEMELARVRREGDRRLDELTPTQTREREQIEQETRRRLDEIAERYASARRDRRSLAQLLADTVAHAAEVYDIVPPEDLRIELLLQERVRDFSPSSFLADLCSRAQVDLAWDRERLPESLPLPTGLVSVETEGSLAGSAGVMDELGLRRVVSFNPLSVTVVQMCHGLSMAAIPHFEAYREDFRASDQVRRSRLAIAHAVLGRDA